MSYLFTIAADRFEGYRRNDSAIDASLALDEIDDRHLELAEMIVAVRDTMLHGQACDIERVPSMLHATLALLTTIAAPFDAVQEEMRRLRKIAATDASRSDVATPASE